MQLFKHNFVFHWLLLKENIGVSQQVMMPVNKGPRTHKVAINCFLVLAKKNLTLLQSALH